MVKFEEQLRLLQGKELHFFIQISNFSHEMRLAFTDECIEKGKNQDRREIVCNPLNDSTKLLQ